MKELFTGFFIVSLTGSLIVGAILLLRLVFRKAPKALICILWGLVFLRLLLPFPIQVNWSIRPELPALSTQNTQQIVWEEVDTNQAIPDLLIQEYDGTKTQNKADVVDVGAAIWLMGAAVMLAFALISYLKLRNRVKDARETEPGIFVSHKLDTAFVLGYFVPGIYLPQGMDDAAVQMVVAHEKTHIKRLDHWLKLLCYVALAIHWFNPIVWVAYVFLCKDVEDACDEAVIRNLNAQERKDYSTALLACGKEKRILSACPVAFGEISIRQRILNVLHYRKPAAWICILAVLAIVLTAVFFMTDHIKKHAAYYEELMNLLGEPVETVCRELGLSPEEIKDLTGSGDIYTTPLMAEYQGIPFAVRLCFERGSGLLSSYQYVAEYQGDYNQIVQPASKIAKHLLKAYGKVYQWDQTDREKQEFVTSEEEIRKAFQHPDRIYGEQWDLTKYASKSSKTYLAQIDVSSVCQEHYAENARKYKVSPHFYLSFHAYGDRHENKSYLVLEYITGWQPGNYSVKITSDLDWGVDADATTWWEKLWNWLK